jgi:hypothetical protein
MSKSLMAHLPAYNKTMGIINSFSNWMDNRKIQANDATLSEEELALAKALQDVNSAREAAGQFFPTGAPIKTDYDGAKISFAKAGAQVFDDDMTITFTQYRDTRSLKFRTEAEIDIKSNDPEGTYKSYPGQSGKYTYAGSYHLQDGSLVPREMLNKKIPNVADHFAKDPEFCEAVFASLDKIVQSSSLVVEDIDQKVTQHLAQEAAEIEAAEKTSHEKYMELKSLLNDNNDPASLDSLQQGHSVEPDDLSLGS